jgi:hypothetical protein
MANNYFSKQDPTDFSIQSEDGGGLIFSKDAKYIFGAKQEDITKQLNEEGYQGNVDINPNTNSSFIAIMNENSIPVDVNIPNTNQYSIFQPQEENIITTNTTPPTPSPSPSVGYKPSPSPSISPSPTPPVSLTFQEIEEGIYEANFLPAVETTGSQIFIDIYNIDPGLNENIVDLTTKGVIKSTDITKDNTPVIYNLSDVSLNEISTYIKFSSGGALNDWKNGLINPNVVKDIATASKAVGIVVTITTAKTGHDRSTTTGTESRHVNGTGVDIAILNLGFSYGSPEFKSLGDKLKNALVQLGYKWNTEVGFNKSVLWQTKNHYNHLHISNTNK